ncbi:helix-turn-helix transcriptional regulator [Litorimonas sp. WD9-15]|uniref:helix-turn-helix transcriptional regulator n=1 Tax=Litorimonas sp. WD9-15 TaxID=3418716 RepID=UPI003D052400
MVGEIKDVTADRDVRRLFANIDAMMSAAQPAETFEIFNAALAHYGFDKVVLGQAFIMADAGAADRRFFYHYGMDDFLAVYAQKNYQFSDPVTLRVMRTHRPFRWREAHVDMTKRQMEQVAEAQAAGLKFGIVFPVVDEAGATGFVSLGRETDFSLSDAAFLELELLCRYAYFAIDRHFESKAPQKTIKLTPRETAILLHVAHGKTNWETGQIMGISEYSVRDYLKSLSARLETSNRTHTVVKAIQLGLILP